VRTQVWRGLGQLRDLRTPVPLFVFSVAKFPRLALRSSARASSGRRCDSSRQLPPIHRAEGPPRALPAVRQAPSAAGALPGIPGRRQGPLARTPWRRWPPRGGTAGPGLGSVRSPESSAPQGRSRPAWCATGACLASSAGPLPWAQPERTRDARSAPAHAGGPASGPWTAQGMAWQGSSPRSRVSERQTTHTHGQRERCEAWAYAERTCTAGR